MTVEIIVDAPVSRVWSLWTKPEHITKWNHISDEWETPTAGIDLRVGGRFFYRMESKKAAAGWDYEGTYTTVNPPENLAYTLDDGRHIELTFSKKGEKTHIHQSFDVLNSTVASQEYLGWQAILMQFKKYAEQ